MAYVKTTYIDPKSMWVYDGQSYVAVAAAAAAAAEDERLAQAIAQLEAQRPEIERRYDELAREAYSAFVSGGEALANSLASAGLYNSGYSDSIKAGRLAAYREDQSRAQRERLGALTEIDRQISAQKSENRAKLSEIEEYYAKLGLSQYNSDREYEYRLARDAVADARYASEQSRLSEKDAWEDELSKAKLAASYGDYSGLKALGIDTSAYEAAEAEKRERESMAARWSIAMKALEAGDTSYLKALGADTSAMDRKLSDALAAEAYSQSPELDPIAYEQAVSMAQGYVKSQLENGKTLQETLDALSTIRHYVVKNYGEAFWEVYLNAVLENYPGSTKYKEKKDSSKAAFSVKDYYQMFSYALGSGQLDQSELEGLIAQTGLTEQEKKELINMLEIALR
jgi:hypothetical protein